MHLLSVCNNDEQRRRDTIRGDATLLITMSTDSTAGLRLAYLPNKGAVRPAIGPSDRGTYESPFCCYFVYGENL